MIVFEYCVILGLTFFNITEPAFSRSKNQNKTRVYEQKIKPYGKVKMHS
jgi:hypothetical protein